MGVRVNKARRKRKTVSFDGEGVMPGDLIRHGGDLSVLDRNVTEPRLGAAAVVDHNIAKQNIVHRFSSSNFPRCISSKRL